MDKIYIDEPNELDTHLRPPEFLSIPKENEKSKKAFLETLLPLYPFVYADRSDLKNYARTVNIFLIWISKRFFPTALFFYLYIPDGVNISYIQKIFNEDIVVVSRRGVNNLVKIQSSSTIENLIGNELLNKYNKEKQRFTTLRDLLEYHHLLNNGEEEKAKIIDDGYKKSISIIYNDRLRKKVGDAYLKLKELTKELYNKFGNKDKAILDVNEFINNFHKIFFDTIKKTKDPNASLFKGILSNYFDDNKLKNLLETINILNQYRGYHIAFDNIDMYNKNKNIPIEYNTTFEDDANNIDNLSNNIDNNVIEEAVNTFSDDFDKYWKKFKEEILKIAEELRKKPEELKSIKVIPNEKATIGGLLNAIKMDSNISIVFHFNNIEALKKYNHYGLCKIAGSKLFLSDDELSTMRYIRQVVNDLTALKKYLPENLFKRESFKLLNAQFGLESPISKALFNTFEVIDTE